MNILACIEVKREEGLLKLKLTDKYYLIVVKKWTEMETYVRRRGENLQ